MSVTVKVALRVRPLNEKEIKDNNQSIIQFIPHQPQHILFDRKQYFNFDYVFQPQISQNDIYLASIQPLFDQFIKGFNATILAYGQTGSGKTYSMGTDCNRDEQNEGILPRFTKDLFHWIDQQSQQINEKSQITYQVKVSFLELYNEDIIDLLNEEKFNNNITIREDTNGNISWSGVHDEPVKGSADLLNCLYQGSIARTTASTDMNSKSSRSHAIFTVTLVQNISTILNQEIIKKKIESKFHFVDLAGSERLKKTNAVGDRAREGISINSGLLALGNVISALTDQPPSYIPYRNSKLTRLLQDSLGGNSQTLMLACVSPAESNGNETSSTLKYATRAKNITNTVTLNQEQSPTDALKEEIVRLKEEALLNDAFMKEVHLELEDLRQKNQTLEGLLGLPPHEIAAHYKLKKPQDPILNESTSTSSKRKRKTYSASDRKKFAAIDLDQDLSLDKHRNRIKKDTLFIKQLKSNALTTDPLAVINKLTSIVQTSIKEQKQLIQYIDGLQDGQKKKPVEVPLEKPAAIVTHLKPSKIKQPRTFSSSTHDPNQQLTLENQIMSQQLVQISNALKKAISLASGPTGTQIKPLLSRALSLALSTQTKKPQPPVVHQHNSSTSSKKSKGGSISNKTSKSVHVEELHQKLREIIAIDHIKSHPVCLEILKSFKQEKIKLLREQKELLKERKDMLKEYYKDDFEEQQQMQQYMDERIDIITVQVDYLSEIIKMLNTSNIPSFINKSNQSNLIELLKPLREGDLRALILLIIQQDLVAYHIHQYLNTYTATALRKYQQGIVQIRRTTPDLNNQIIQDIVKSPIRCLSNGLLLISGK